jgi:hypothetical protein
MKNNQYRVASGFWLCIVLILSANNSWGQASCPIPCTLEQFPYFFCPGPDLECSSNPNAPGLTPLKAFLPNCIHVDQTSTDDDGNTLSGMPSGGKVQPFGQLPGPKPIEACGDKPVNSCGDKPVNSCGDKPVNSCGDEPIDMCGDEPVWDGDSSDYADWLSLDETWHTCETDFGTAHDTWVTCHSDFISDSSTWVSCTSDFITDSTTWANCESLFIPDSITWASCDSAFNIALSTWETDSAAVEYVTVWNDGDAQSEAQNALNEWYAACPGITQNDCCVRVKFDYDEGDFDNANYAIGSSGIELALTPVPVCGAGCPDSNTFFINVNVSPQFLFASNTNPLPDTNYADTVASRTFFTTPTAPNVNPGFETYSFQQMIEHELGHWFGFAHTNNNNCSNNADSCAGFPSVMVTNQPTNTNPLAVTCEDLNMFRKLYCPSTPCTDCLASVAETVAASTFKAVIFPNPTSGACLLQYQLADPASVQITIYDMLGKEVRLVSDAEEESGIQSISLGTESLPSGSYVCRVRVGDKESYINLVITK